MPGRKRKWFYKALLVLLVLGCVVFIFRDAILNLLITHFWDEDPKLWEREIIAFEKAASASPPPRDAIVFIGSSSIRLWSSLQSDMHPVPVIQRGFGGARMHDVVFYGARLLQVEQPRALVVFVGTNDIHPGMVQEPTVLLNRFQQFVAIARAEFAEIPIYYIGITPSPLRWEVWGIAQQTNALIADYAASDPQLHIIDTAPHLLGASGEPNPKNYRFDGLHLSEKGYAIWAEIIRARLLADFPDYISNSLSK